MELLKKIGKSFFYSINGLLAAYQKDQSFRLEVWASSLFLVFGYFVWPLREIEILFLMLGFCLILISELFNTAFERMLERIHPARHEIIGEGKDIASAAVFVAILFTLAVAVSIVWARII